MFTEILKIKPVLDNASAKQMESSLSGRFQKVSKRFGKGLMQVIKGSVLGISLGLLNKLLNPIAALEEKIKTLLGQGTDITEMADQFNTTPGRLKQLQNVGQSLGVEPDELKDMLTKYASAVEKARKEFEDPTSEISPASKVVKNFTNETDMAEGFFKFLQSLKAEGAGSGQDVFFGEREQRKAAERARLGITLPPEERERLMKQGLLKQQSGLESRQAMEETVFGAPQFGAAKKLIETDFVKQLAKINSPNEAVLTKAINKTAKLAEQQRQMQVSRETSDLVKTSRTMNPKMITDMENAAQTEADKLTKQLESYDNLRKAADGIIRLEGMLLTVTNLAAQGVGYLGDLSNRIGEFFKSGWYRRLFGGGK